MFTIPPTMKHIIYRLKILRHAINVFNDPTTQPSGDHTYCNIAVQFFAHLWGLNQFDGMLANNISDEIDGGHPWVPCSPSVACRHANTGYLVIAHQKGNPNGHVAAVIPTDRFPHHSMSWRDVPVLSMGRTPVIGLGLSKVFRTEPAISAYIPPTGGYPKSDS